MQNAYQFIYCEQNTKEEAQQNRYVDVDHMLANLFGRRQEIHADSSINVYIL